MSMDASQKKELDIGRMLFHEDLRREQYNDAQAA